MNRLLLVLLLASASAFAAPEVPINNSQLGSGTPSNITVGVSNASLVDDRVYFTPQYMPGFPTAATLWPRVVEVECSHTAFGNIVCEGYHWTPNLGRGEYLFVTPRFKEPVVTPPPIIVPVLIEKTTVIKEVPVKPGKE